jgi:hypothetical protein
MFGGILRGRHRVTKLGVAWTAALAASLFGASGALAAASRLELAWEQGFHELKAGEPFEMVLGHYSEASNRILPNTFTVETEHGGVTTCTGSAGPYSGVGGVDVTDDEVTDKIELQERAAGVIEGYTECPSTLGPETTVNFFPEYATLELNGSKGTAKVKARSSTQPMSISISSSSLATCIYTATKLTGKLTFEKYYSLHPWQQLVITFKKQKFEVLDPEKDPNCFKKASITASFGEQTTGEGGFGEGPIVFGDVP